MTNEEILDRLRPICLSLPEAEERQSHGTPSWFYKGKRHFAALDDHHHGVDHFAVWLNGTLEAQTALVESDPITFFRPPYVGVRGWIGVRLTENTDWDDVASLVEEAHRIASAPAKPRQQR